eukprot:CAMPEP_0113481062 /NCGR_PEP_ID=MMETSP0014_2-20120614/22209_1 /TAXON_ID=2857 /ORGANISM="Nitzschia sp." /LENGTH=80 /DNA_ID=CAMNT_0000374535 /DNA_START=457 /DNA_END=699 /DNA_ORIENTATION=- /assembly_acc=CAM_ASM_000159
MTILANGNLIDAPKNWSNNKGVIKIPAILLRTALQIDAATFPPDADVNMIHILTVVGSVVIMRIPSAKACGKKSNGTKRL